MFVFAGVLTGSGAAVQALESHVERLAAAVEEAVAGESEWGEQVSAGVGAGLDFLAADPACARLLLVEAPREYSMRHEYERALVRLANALSMRSSGPGDAGVSGEQARLLAGGLVSHLSGRVLAGEVKRLPEDRELLLRYLLAFSPRYTF